MKLATSILLAGVLAAVLLGACAPNPPQSAPTIALPNTPTIQVAPTMGTFVTPPPLPPWTPVALDPSLAVLPPVPSSTPAPPTAVLPPATSTAQRARPTPPPLSVPATTAPATRVARPHGDPSAVDWATVKIYSQGQGWPCSSSQTRVSYATSKHPPMEVCIDTFSWSQAALRQAIADEELWWAQEEAKKRQTEDMLRR